MGVDGGSDSKAHRCFLDSPLMRWTLGREWVYVGGTYCCIQRLASAIANQTGLSSESWKWTGRRERDGRWRESERGRGRGWEREGGKEEGRGILSVTEIGKSGEREGGREEEEVEEGIERNRGGGSRRENE